jgi:hypothetical protein
VTNDLEQRESEWRESKRLFFDHIQATREKWEEGLRLKAGSFFQRYGFLDRVLREARREANRVAALDFSIIDLFWCDESRLSNVIKDLLDPNGTHGQGELFLSLFLSRVNLALPENKRLPPTNLGQTQASLEVSTDTLENSQRRIDIVLINPAWVLGIENKPWTYEQPDQLNDYQKHLDNAYKDRHWRQMAYLSGICAKPNTAGPEQSVAVIGYNWSPEKCSFHSPELHLSHWLEEGAQLCQADKVRQFLKDFSCWIKKNFNNQVLECGHEEICHEHE